MLTSYTAGICYGGNIKQISAIRKLPTRRNLFKKNDKPKPKLITRDITPTGDWKTSLSILYSEFYETIRITGISNETTKITDGSDDIEKKYFYFDINDEHSKVEISQDNSGEYIFIVDTSFDDPKPYLKNDNNTTCYYLHMKATIGKNENNKLQIKLYSTSFKYNIMDMRYIFHNETKTELKFTITEKDDGSYSYVGEDGENHDTLVLTTIVNMTELTIYYIPRNEETEIKHKNMFENPMLMSLPIEDYNIEQKPFTALDTLIGTIDKSYEPIV